MRTLQSIGAAALGVCLLATPTFAQTLTGTWYGLVQNYTLGDARRTMVIAEKDGKLTCTFDVVGQTSNSMAKSCAVTSGVVEMVNAANNVVRLAPSGDALVGTLTFTATKATFQLSMGRDPHVVDAVTTGSVGDWAIGLWKGTEVHAPMGGGGLTIYDVSLFVAANGGKLSCTWAGKPTKNCAIGTDRITFVSAWSADIDLQRSGPNSLAGTVKYLAETYNVKTTATLKR